MLSIGSGRGLSSGALLIEARAQHREAKRLRAHDGFGTAHKQHATGCERRDKTLVDALFGLFGEVDHDVAARDQVEWSPGIGIAEQVMLLEADRRAWGGPY